MKRLMLLALIALAGCTGGGVMPHTSSASAAQVAQPTPTPPMASGTIVIH